jgi:hypothetical protein
LLTFLPSVFFTSGEAPGLAGVPEGDVDGLGDGITVAVGAGVETGFTGSCGLLLQAPKAATLAARRVEIIMDLLIVFSSLFSVPRTHAVRCTDIHSQTGIECLSAEFYRPSWTGYLPFVTNAAPE